MRNVNDFETGEGSYYNSRTGKAIESQIRQYDHYKGPLKVKKNSGKSYPKEIIATARKMMS